jgi:hypothetical protein
LHPRIYGTEIEYGVFSWDLVPQYVELSDFLEGVREVIGSLPATRNGSRIYMDHGRHPEYCTPECLTPLEIVLHEKAGEKILEGLFADDIQFGDTRGSVWLYRTTDDKRGTTHGYHENYLMERAEKDDQNIWVQRRERDHITRCLIPFFVTRVIYAGSGNVADDEFEISGRAKYIDKESYVYTQRNRPIVHLKDEPLCERSQYRRLHVIVGEPNLSEYATFLKIGTTSLVLDLVEDGLTCGLSIENPVEALHRLSRSTSDWHLTLEDGNTISAIDVQRVYLNLAYKHFDQGCDKDSPDMCEMNRLILTTWERTLDALERDPMVLAEEVDWAIEKKLLEGYTKRNNLSWGHPNIAKADLRFHEVGERSLFAVLQRKGHVKRLLTDEEIEAAMVNPPDTRAKGRALFVERLAERGVKLASEVEMWNRLGEGLEEITKQPPLKILDPFQTYEEEVEEYLAGVFS